MARVLNASVSGSHRPATVDVALAAVFATGASIEVWLGEIPGPAGAKLTLALVPTLGLAWRSVAPLTTVVVTSGACAFTFVLGVPADEPLLPVLAPVLAVYSLGARGRARDVLAGTTFAVAAYTVAVVADDVATESFVMNTVAVLGAVVVGRAVRAMGFEADVLEARSSQLERERDERADAAVAEERARVARELHDVIGHSISVMGVQAGAVRRRLAPEQARERDALLAVERVGRDAVEEMQRLLGFLRTDGADADLGTRLTLQRLERLADGMRGAGLEIDLLVEGPLDDLPAGRAIAAFRILQEALTNVLRHAPGARVEVVLRRTDAELRIDVADDGGASGQEPDRTGGGHGLVGMRERVALYGGTLQAGPRASGGFEVSARVPLGAG